MNRTFPGALTFALLFFAVSASVSTGGPAGSEGRAVTFTKDVGPILQKNCMACHRPGEIAPMPLTSYAEVRPWAKAIREAVASRKMPPWHADNPAGIFENDPRLTQKEIDTIVSWVDGGSKQGDPKDLPPNPTFVEGWTIGKPDVTLSMREEFTIPAEGVVPYKYFEVPTNFREDTWVQAAEIRPGNRSVVHHVIAFVREPGKNLTDPVTGEEVGRGGRAGASGRNPEATPRRNDSPLTESRLDGMLVGTAPGMPPFTFKPGQAKLVKAGSSLILQMHYTPNGFEEKDRTSVGLILGKGPVDRRVITLFIAGPKIRIPPGDPNYEVRASFTFPADARVLSMMPHMHVRGKDFKYTAVYPDGRQQVLLNVPRWDFNWQHIYRFREPVIIPKGSRIDCVAHFDNSANNKFNPDPTKEVYWGDQTWEEMMIGFTDFVFEKPLVAESTAVRNQQ